MSAYKLVPVEPTEKMLNAGLGSSSAEMSEVVWVYKAMLAAAPGVGECRKHSFWVVYDATSDRKYIKMDSGTGCLGMFDNEECAAIFATGCAGADYKELTLYSCPQPADSALVEASDAGRRAAQAEVHRLRDWVKETASQYDICTRNVLREVCDGCRCRYRKQGGE